MRKTYQEIEVEEMLERKFKNARSETSNIRIINEYESLQTSGSFRGKGGIEITLKSNQHEIFLNLKGEGILPLVHPMRLEMVDMSRSGVYCEYHKDFGHSTSNCKNLARVIS